MDLLSPENPLLTPPSSPQPTTTNAKSHHRLSTASIQHVETTATHLNTTAIYDPRPPSIRVRDYLDCKAPEIPSINVTPHSEREDGSNSASGSGSGSGVTAVTMEQPVPFTSPWTYWFQEDTEGKDSPADILAPAISVQTALDEFLATACLSQHESHVLTHTHTLSDVLLLTVNAQEAWTRRKHSRAKDAALRRVAYLNTLAENYKGTVEAVKSSQPALAGVAFGMVGLVVGVVANKAKMNGEMDGALRDISQSLPRLEVYGKLYPTLEMQRRVADLFAKVVEFLQYAYLYYRMPGWKRTLRAFTDPPEATLTPLIDSITDLSTKIRNEASLAGSAELRTISARLEGLSQAQHALASAQARLMSTSSTIVDRIAELERGLDEVDARLAEREKKTAMDELKAVKPRLVDAEWDVVDAISRQKGVLDRIPVGSVEAEYARRLVEECAMWSTLPPESPQRPQPPQPPVQKNILWLTPEPRCAFRPTPIFLSRTSLLLGARIRVHSPTSIVILHNLAHLPPCSPENPSILPVPLLRHLLYDLLTQCPALLRTNEVFRPLTSPLHQSFTSHEELWPWLDALIAHFRGVEKRSVVWVLDGFEKVEADRNARGAERLGVVKFLSRMVEAVGRGEGWFRVVVLSGKALGRVDLVRVSEVEEVKERVWERLVGWVPTVEGESP